MARTRTIGGFILAGLLTLAMTASAIGKLTGGAAGQFAGFGLADWVVLIALGEIATAFLFLIPATLPLGLLFQSSYWGGAIVTHMIDGTSFVVPAVILVVAWGTAYIRRPEIFAGLLPQPRQ